ncbi:MAG: toast rack family protein [Tunicatimonas sp.]
MQPTLHTFASTLLVLFVLATACSIRSDNNQEESNELRTLTETVARNNVDRLTTRISIGAGKLLVTAGADQLMEADFEYSQESWKPEIDFQSEGAEGQLSIDQPGLTDDFNFNFGNNQRNEWSIRLNDEVLQTLECRMGAGESELDLRGLTLRRVDIDAGVGEHEIILANTSLPELTVDVGVGEVTLDLSGTWRNNLRAQIDGGIGELNLRVPANVGVRLDVSGGLGSVDVPPSYTKDGNVYVNAAYQEAEYRLEIDVDAGIGSVEVEEEEN